MTSFSTSKVLVVLFLLYGLSATANSETQNSLGLTSFTLEKKESSNLLKWSTVDETNTVVFQIWRSSDAVNFVLIDTVTLATTSTEISNNSYIDNNPPDGINYYRLCVVESDGGRTYSEIVSVDNTSGLFQIGPNPVTDVLNIRVGAEEWNDAVVVDRAGQPILSANLVQIQCQGSSVSLDVSDITPGIYYVVLTNPERETQTVCFIKN